MVRSAEECVERICYLLTHEAERLVLGAVGKAHVRANFLTPRLLRDELRLAKELLMPTVTAALAGTRASSTSSEALTARGAMDASAWGARIW